MSRARKVRCPKCKGRALAISETTNAYQQFAQDSRGIVDRSGYMSHGSVTRIDCTCDGCGHTWKPRGVLQITDFLDHATKRTP